MKLLSQWFDYNNNIIAEVFYEHGLYTVKSDLVGKGKVCFNSEQAAEDFAEYIYYKAIQTEEE